MGLRAGEQHQMFSWGARALSRTGWLEAAQQLRHDELRAASSAALTADRENATHWDGSDARDVHATGIDDLPREMGTWH